MNPVPSEFDRIFPLSGGSSERARLRAPRLFNGSTSSGLTLGRSAFMRSWTTRRLAIANAAAEARERAAQPLAAVAVR